MPHHMERYFLIYTILSFHHLQNICLSSKFYITYLSLDNSISLPSSLKNSMVQICWNCLRDKKSARQIRFFHQYYINLHAQKETALTTFPNKLRIKILPAHLHWKQFKILCIDISFCMNLMSTALIAGINIHKKILAFSTKT